MFQLSTDLAERGELASAMRPAGPQSEVGWSPSADSGGSDGNVGKLSKIGASQVLDVQTPTEMSQGHHQLQPQPAQLLSASTGMAGLEGGFVHGPSSEPSLPPTLSLAQSLAPSQSALDSLPRNASDAALGVQGAQSPNPGPAGGPGESLPSPAPAGCNTLNSPSSSITSWSDGPSRESRWLHQFQFDLNQV